MAERDVIIPQSERSAQIVAAFPARLGAWKEQVARHLAVRRDAYLPGNDLLDQIVDGKLTVEALDAMQTEHYVWCDDLLGAVTWWIDLSNCVLQGWNPDPFAGGPNPEFAEQRSELAALLADVMNAYVPALQETSAYTKEWGTLGGATFELLRRYRLYTRFVESFVLEVFPDLNRELLLRPNFGFKGAAA